MQASVQETSPWQRLEGLLSLLPPAERLRAETELARMRHDQQRAEAELREMVYVTSHDLTEPLRMVTSYLQLLERRNADALDDSGREFVFFARDGAERMQVLLADLLRYSRVDSRGGQRAPVAVADVVAEVLHDLGAATTDAGAVVQVDGDLPTIVADRVQLGQLLQNLVANALKFQPPAGARTPEVVISALRVATPAPGWRITVADNGIGIAGAQVDRIWRVFQRLHSREEYLGTGIGLAICRRVADRHGARLWVTSQPGVGSAFHVCFPDEPVLAHAGGPCCRPATTRRSPSGP